MAGPILDNASRLATGFDQVVAALLERREASGHWVGELSTSALSTSTACAALQQLRLAGVTTPDGRPLTDWIENGLQWLATHQNRDGGWGDTTLNTSNISTAMLAHAAFWRADDRERYADVLQRVETYIRNQGGTEALLARYGRDRTFSIPILTQCALAGTVEWSEVLQLPFEMACVPARYYAAVRMPVVSYALPALIAIGQARHHHRPTRIPGLRWLRNRLISPSLSVLERIQPPNGGFLEATPLTSFVTMSLASVGQHDHPVARRGLEFILSSVRTDGSWPIDTDLATWVTTLSINALDGRLPDDRLEVLLDWLLDQQYREVHPYTNAAPGGWAWTDLPGGVPDADDTPGAILAVLRLAGRLPDAADRAHAAVARAVVWLLDLQNRDGGWPTFCRGWGKLPFDRSSADLTAHVLRAFAAWQETPDRIPQELQQRMRLAIERGVRFLRSKQRTDGSWLPLWFGNQHSVDEENATYGTSRVLLALEGEGATNEPVVERGRAWLRQAQNDDGGWGAGGNTPSSVEETALAVEALASDTKSETACGRGVDWLLESIENGQVAHPSPIGFYFAKLWYFESLYPLIHTVSALRRWQMSSHRHTPVSSLDSAHLNVSTRT